MESDMLRKSTLKIQQKKPTQQQRTVMNTVVPLISSGIAGPLGVLHLPRLWLKVSLEARGKLAPGYPGAGKGYDQMVIDGLGLNRDAVLAYIKDEAPTYPQFEAWVKKQPGVTLDKASVDKLNASIRIFIHDDATRKGILSASELPDDGSAARDAINLNNLDDWKEFHTAELLPAAPASLVKDEVPAGTFMAGATSAELQTARETPPDGSLAAPTREVGGPQARGRE